MSVLREKELTPKPADEPVDDGGDGDNGDGNDGDGDDGEEEEEEEEVEPPEIEVGFDLNDLLNKIPFMFPRKEPCTWRSDSIDFHVLVEKRDDSGACMQVLDRSGT